MATSTSQCFPTNRDRAAWAQAALDAFKAQTGMQDESNDIVLSDLLDDLMHLAQMEGINFTACVERAVGHFVAEVLDEAEEASARRR